MIAKITKMAPVNYYVVNGVEFNANELFCTLETIVEGDPFELDYALYDIAQKLYDMGYVRRRFIYHEDVLYYDTEDKKAKALFEEILKM